MLRSPGHNINANQGKPVYLDVLLHVEFLVCNLGNWVGYNVLAEASVSLISKRQFW